MTLGFSLRNSGSVQQMIAVFLVAVFAVPAPASDTHVLTIAELHGAMAQAATDRQANQEAIDHFLALSRVQTTLHKAGIEPEQIHRAASLLSDEEQSTLAAKARSAESDITGGELKDSQITLIILAVAAFCFLTVLVLAFK